MTSKPNTTAKTNTGKATSTKEASAPAAVYQPGTLAQVAPTSLLMERNVREATPDAGLVKSIQALGVLEPVTAVITADNTLMVRRGHRRTLAAIEAGLDTIPVIISDHDSADDQAEIARIIGQHDENTHRTGLSTAEEVGVVTQLAAFGLSPAQIAKQARIKRANIDAAQAVAASELATKATARYDQLTLDQAVIVAEFDHDPETVKALIAATATGQFDHVAQRARDERDRTAAIAQVIDQLTEQGRTVIDPPAYDSPVLRDFRLRSPDREAIAEQTHIECPGHVVWPAYVWVYTDAEGNELTEDAYDDLDEDAAEQVEQVRRWGHEWGCSDYKANGHLDSYASSTYGSNVTKTKAEDMSPDEREAKKKARQLVVDNNKAWTSATTVRREWLTTLATAKTAPKGTAKFLATALSEDGHLMGERDGNALAAEWLGKPSPTGYGRVDLTAPKTATDNRALHIALVQVLGCYEAAIASQDRARGSWRSDNTKTATGRYLRFLDATGYTLSDVEKYAISAKTA